MKTTLALLSVCLVAAGCASVDRLYTKTPVVTPGTVTTNTAIIPQIVTFPAFTNPATGEIAPGGSLTNFVEAVEVVTTPPRTNYVLTPRAEAQAVVSAVSSLPFHWMNPSALALGWLYSAYAALRNRKLAVALVQGIEAGREFLQTTAEGQRIDGQIKDALIHHQEIAGVLDAAGRLVTRYTGNTVR